MLATEGGCQSNEGSATLAESRALFGSPAAHEVHVCQQHACHMTVSL